jgi:hypothetical protein
MPKTQHEKPSTDRRADASAKGRKAFADGHSLVEQLKTAQVWSHEKEFIAGFVDALAERVRTGG